MACISRTAACRFYNTLDYPTYSIAIEEVKAAYRLAYSLFDKIAFFLNAYLDLKLDESRVYFRGVWYVNADRKQGIRPELDRSENWPLRGLYWLAKDLFDKDFHDVTEPDAQALYAVRNQLEHRYLKVHEIYSAADKPDCRGQDVDRRPRLFDPEGGFRGQDATRPQTRAGGPSSISHWQCTARNVVEPRAKTMRALFRWSSMSGKTIGSDKREKLGP